MPIKTSTFKLRVENLEIFGVFFTLKKQRRVFCFDNGLLVLKEADGKVLFLERKV